MNSEGQSEKSESRRVKRERFVWEAVELVQRWRDMFENGFYDEVGNFRKPTLKQAAQIVGAPKKTLEDYHQILKKSSEYVDVMRVLDKKMGYLRQLVKEFKYPQPSPITAEQTEYEPCNEQEWDNMIIEDSFGNDDKQQSEPCCQSSQQQCDDFLEFQFQEQQYYFDDDYLFEDRYINPALPDS